MHVIMIYDYKENLSVERKIIMYRNILHLSLRKKELSIDNLVWKEEVWNSKVGSKAKENDTKMERQGF